jgi:hypothetical protein
VNNKLKGMWKEVSVALFEIISRQLPWGTEISTIDIGPNNLHPERGLDPKYPKYPGKFQ